MHLLKKILFATTVIGLGVIATTQVVYAMPVTYNFTGEIRDYYYDPVEGDPYGGSIASGTAMQGTISYDPASVFPDNNPDPARGDYFALSLTNYLKFNVGGNLFWNNIQLFIDVSNYPAGDSIGFSTLNQFAGGFGVEEGLGLALGGPNTMFSDDSVPTELPGFSVLTNAGFSYTSGRFGTSDDKTLVRYVGRLTSLSPAAIPEPASIALMSLGLIGLGLSRIGRKQFK